MQTGRRCEGLKTVRNRRWTPMRAVVMPLQSDLFVDGGEAEGEIGQLLID